MFRIGQGFDVHRLVEGRKLILGGVEIPYHKGLLGHSDADVLIHALIDALLGALALGDIGKLFPDTDMQYRDANSRELLRLVVRTITQKHFYSINNIDATIILEQPKLASYIEQIRENLAQDLSINKDLISIKAKTYEGLGEIGNGDAAASQVVVLLIK